MKFVAEQKEEQRRVNVRRRGTEGKVVVLRGSANHMR